MRLRNKADLTEKLDTDETHKGSLSIFAYLANFKKYKYHQKTHSLFPQHLEYSIQSWRI